MYKQWDLLNSERNCPFILGIRDELVVTMSPGLRPDRGGVGVGGGRNRAVLSGVGGSGFPFAAVLVVDLVDFFRAHGAEPPSGDEGEVV